MRIQDKPFPPVVALACAAASLVACSGEIVDLGRNYEAGAPAAEASVQVQPGLDGGGGFFGVAIASDANGPICPGSCVHLLASVTGGTGPFSYLWGDTLGEGAGPVTVCPTVTTTYAVLVRSSSQSSPATTVVTVEPCDSGVITPPPHDSGAMQAADTGTQTGSSSLCITNPSFEGTPAIGTLGTPPGMNATAAPPGWQVCQGDPDIDPSVSPVPASDGMTYLGLSVGSGSFSSPLTEAIGTTLCAPLQAGVRYSFCMDLAIGVRGVNLTFGGNPLMMSPGGPAPVLDIFGGTTACGQEEPLFISQAITNVDSWSKVCSTFMPTRTLTTLTLVPSLGSSSTTSPPAWSYVIIDHITSP
jgi:hypothetical protein